MPIPFLGSIVKASIGSTVRAANYFNGKKLFEAVDQNNIDLIKKYIYDGGSMEITWDEDFVGNIMNLNMVSLINYTIEQDRFDIFKFLVDEGCDINSNINALTPLGTAIKYDRKRHFDYLISKKVMLDARGSEKALNYGTTPLIEAVERGRLNYVEELIKNGANITRTSRYGDIPIYFAIKGKDRFVIFQYLLDHMSDEQINMLFMAQVFTVLHAIASEGAYSPDDAIDKLDYLLKRNVSLDKLNRHGASALYRAEETLYSNNNQGRNEFYIAQEKIVERLKAAGAKSYFKGELRQAKPFYLYKTDTYA